MPAVSQAQQRFMAIAEHHPEMLRDRMPNMTRSQMHDFAATPIRGLPKYVGKYGDGGNVEVTGGPSPSPTATPAYYAKGGPVRGRLTAAQRQALPARDFALPGKGTGPKGAGAGSYPIPDASHARNALSRVAQHGSPAEQTTVRRKVHAKFPGIGQQFARGGVAMGGMGGGMGMPSGDQEFPGEAQTDPNEPMETNEPPEPKRPKMLNPRKVRALRVAAFEKKHGRHAI